jgi:hypothetical protein
MGLAEKGTLEFNCNFISKNQDEKKLLGLFDELDKMDISFDKLIFFSQEKNAVMQKKLLKKVCKIFIADVIDVLPDKERYLTSVVERVCIFSKSHQRLVRYSFTYVGLYIYKNLLAQYKELDIIRKQLDSKLKNEKKLKVNTDETAKQLTAIENALDIIRASYETI